MVFPGLQTSIRIDLEVATVIGLQPFKIRFDKDKTDTVRSYFKPKGLTLSAGDRIAILTVGKKELILGAFEEVM